MHEQPALLWVCCVWLLSAQLHAMVQAKAGDEYTRHRTVADTFSRTCMGRQADEDCKRQGGHVRLEAGLRRCWVRVAVAGGLCRASVLCTAQHNALSAPGCSVALAYCSAACIEEALPYTWVQKHCSAARLQAQAEKQAGPHSPAASCVRQNLKGDAREYGRERATKADRDDGAPAEGQDALQQGSKRRLGGQQGCTAWLGLHHAVQRCESLMQVATRHAVCVQCCLLLLRILRRLCVRAAVTAACRWQCGMLCVCCTASDGNCGHLAGSVTALSDGRQAGEVFPVCV